MQELTDDQLDGLFRKSAEEFDAPFDPAAWEGLKDQLDERDRTAFWKKWLPWGIPLLLLLLTGGGWYTYKNVERPAVSQSVVPSAGRESASSITKAKQPDAVATRSTKTESIGTKRTQAAVPATATEPAPVAITSATTGRVIADKPVKKVSKNTERVATERTVTAYREKPALGGKKLIAGTTMRSEPSTTTADAFGRRLRKTRRKTNFTPGSTFVDRYGRGVAATTATPDYPAKAAVSLGERRAKKSIEEASLTNSNATGSPSMSEGNAPTPATLPTIAELAIRPGKWSKLPESMDREVAYNQPYKAVSVPNSAPVRGLSVRLAVAPDLSAIGLHNFSRPGTNVGMLLEYRIASRWSVQAGVIRSTKVYGATPDQYNTEMVWPKWNVQPVGVDGVCTLLDIPVNVRFDIALRPRQDNRLPPSRWFVSGGVTSYVMLQEDYTYKYPPHTYNQPTQISTRTGGYGFSQLNLSVGYERALSRRLSWQVEPFIKAPVKGVGAYKINLLSTGAFLSLRYKL
ncbi:hypothetical protein M0L20_06280 [Spirosoma sp. RP8]|uniref:PorT family protein n=1 Tax=Spirosoma liriopis TaxID=2937440 RepID=A0ABT0HIG8_9BACT|nr:hypothetical protein [Spirosoma liriopis]MCK8491453.1 hypothetical protein [Spirosoma liriopis]